VLTLARSGEWLARATLDAAQAVNLRLGAEASVEIAGKPVQGHIRALTAQPEGRALLEVALPRAAGTWAGQAASIRLP
jgi:hypothetical protein